MDFSRNLAQVQGFLLKTNNVYNFTVVKSRSGNELKIQNVVESLKKFLTEKYFLADGLIVEKFENDLRQICFFLILNSDLNVLKCLLNSDEISHLIWVTPTIPKCLLIHLIWGLDLHQFWCETIEYSDPVLSAEILEIATQNVKYTSPEDSIKRASSLVSSAYKMLIYMIHSNRKIEDKKSIIDSVYATIFELMKYFIDPPNKLKMSTWTTDQLYHHAGKATLCLFECLICCFKLYYEKPPQPPEKCKIYLCTFNESLGESYSDKKDSNENILEDSLKKLNDFLLDGAKENVMEINVDIYCSWCEHQDTTDPSKSLQKAVGESAFELHEMLKSLEHEVISMLPSIACKPKNLSDFILEGNKETILQRASETSEDQGLWMAALLEKDYFFSDEDCLNCAFNNISIISPADSIKIFKAGVNHLYGPMKSEFANLIKMFIFKCLSLHPNNEQVTIIKEAMKNFKLGNVLQMADYEIQLTDFFNKLLGIDDSKESEMYLLFLQNPSRLYERALKESIAKPQQTEILLSILETLQVFYDLNLNYDFDTSQYASLELSGTRLLIFHSVMQICIEDLTTDAERSSYVCFIKGLIENNLVYEQVIFLRILMPGIHKHLIDKNHNSLYIQLQALKEIFCPTAHAKFIAPLLVMLAQIMEYMRWDVKTFSAAAVNVIDLSIQFQKTTMQTFLQTKQTSDSEFKWLAGKLKFFTPINAYYFQELWPQQPFQEIYDVSLDPKNAMICLCFLLPRTLLSEWKLIFSVMNQKDDLTTNFSFLCSAMKAIVKSAKVINVPNAFSCMEYCCRNAANILQDIISTALKNTEQLLLIQCVLSVINDLPEVIQCDCFSGFLNPLSQLITLYFSNRTEGQDVQELTKMIEELKNEESRNILSKILNQKINY